MSNRAILFMWLAFWLLYLLHPSAWKSKTIPVSDLLEVQRNETAALGNISYPLNAVCGSAVADGTNGKFGW